MKVRDRLEPIASTPEVCPPQTPDIPHHDTNTSTLPHRFRGVVFHWPARCIKPASRDFYPNRDRDDARRGELVMIAIFSIAISAAEAAVGLAMVIAVYRHFRTTNVDQYDQLKG